MSIQAHNRDLGPEGEQVAIGKSVAALLSEPMGKGLNTLNLVVLGFQEKLLESVQSIRTAIRHRWIGREYPGERDNHD